MPLHLDRARQRNKHCFKGQSEALEVSKFSKLFNMIGFAWLLNLPQWVEKWLLQSRSRCMRAYILAGRGPFLGDPAGLDDSIRAGPNEMPSLESPHASSTHGRPERVGGWCAQQPE
jgi:hypothetical protein